jgi:hypothetical protein
MNRELKQELEWINENLKAVVMNQNMLYFQLKTFEDELKENEEKVIHTPGLEKPGEEIDG